MGAGKGRLDEAVLTGTHGLCLGAGMREIAVPLRTPVLLYKSGVHGVYIARTCYRDV